MTEGRRILAKGAEAGIVLRLVGGVAIAVSCEKSHLPQFSRTYGDIDLVGLGDESKKIRQLFEALGYEPNKTFNGLHGRERLLFYDLQRNRQVDIFLNTFRMCHTIDLHSRLRICTFALPPADLLLTKLQAIEINEKDLKDVACLLTSKNIARKDDDDSINVDYISELCAKDWGIYKTLSMNLKRTSEYVQNLDTHYDEIRSKIDEITKSIKERPKTAGWKMRERIGERKRWYDLPEEKREKIATG